MGMRIWEWYTLCWLFPLTKHTCVKRLYDKRRAVDLFFVYSVNDSGLGGRVACSDEFPLGQQLEGLPLILGLLTDWVCPFFPINISEGLTNCSRWTMPMHTISKVLHVEMTTVIVWICPCILPHAKDLINFVDFANTICNEFETWILSLTRKCKNLALAA